jgi:2-C-methyl-D-erythritol 4-phosphate cytidylyltransferase/2-C-methyl-D-erythritol 2,4-cyclodiphosphate synthase
VGVVVAAGLSSRVGGSLPKQFRNLGGRTVLERSIRAIAGRPGIAGVVVVLAAGEVAGPRGRAAGAVPGVISVVAGGRTRAESVREGVRAAGDAPFVLVHDAARPFAPPELVDRVIAATIRDGAAVPGLPVVDTVKEVDERDRALRTLERGRLRLAQTPQGARTEWLARALDRALESGRQVTDEAAALELEGHPVTVVAGDPRNGKITTAEDLTAAERGAKGGATEMRVGSGFDIHHFDPDRPLVLGGVRFPDEPGLAGHSDADVVLHAAMDALLGAAALGDIGTLFPPDDPSFAGADSTVLAREVARRVREAGWSTLNVDLTVLAERPKIKPRSDEMRSAVAECLGLARDRVGLKATTLEGLGALGRREGIACQAVALLRRG